MQAGMSAGLLTPCAGPVSGCRSSDRAGVHQPRKLTGAPARRARISPRTLICCVWPQTLAGTLSSLQRCNPLPWLTFSTWRVTWGQPGCVLGELGSKPSRLTAQECLPGMMRVWFPLRAFPQHLRLTEQPPGSSASLQARGQLQSPQDQTHGGLLASPPEGGRLCCSLPCRGLGSRSSLLPLEREGPLGSPRDTGRSLRTRPLSWSPPEG